MKRRVRKKKFKMPFVRSFLAAPENKIGDILAKKKEVKTPRFTGKSE
jgi:hypothetical protein